ncbi:PilW family protein [Halioxenophilus sp. WMMB6]|uniref:PilW family protein n=1 Tax=Halioxenophilus sp. WMMB6 TaxID=3073815 RepID=UPI00295E5922|nr:PilW family protein [Halioxenophilus sp. WMMB6]
MAFDTESTNSLLPSAQTGIGDSRRQAGFTIIELMVSILLGALLLLSITQSFSSSLLGDKMQRSYSRIQESGRFALEFLSRDIRMADYWGCLSNNDPGVIENNLDTTNANYATAAASIVDSFSQGGLDGENNVAAGTTIGGIDVLAGSDVLTLIGAGGNNSIQVVEPYMNTNSAALHISTGNAIAQGDILLVTDCSGGDIFEVSNSNPDTSGQVSHNTGIVTTVGNGDQNLSRIYTGDALIMMLQAKTYFVGTGFNGRTSLYLSTETGTIEMVPNVDNMEVLYGEDKNGDNVVDQYHDASTVTDMENILAVRITLTVSSEDTGFDDAAATYTLNGITYGGDGRLRKRYTVVTNIRNRMNG